MENPSQLDLNPTPHSSVQNCLVIGERCWKPSSFGSIQPPPNSLIFYFFSMASRVDVVTVQMLKQQHREMCLSLWWNREGGLARKRTWFWDMENHRPLRFVFFFFCFFREVSVYSVEPATDSPAENDEGPTEDQGRLWPWQQLWMRSKPPPYLVFFSCTYSSKSLLLMCVFHPCEVFVRTLEMKNWGENKWHL